MAIDKSRLVVGPTKKRDEEKQFYVSYITSSVPGTTRLYKDETEAVVTDPQLPEVEGQIAIYKPNNGDQLATMYVAVEINGSLEWKTTISLAGLTDSNTAGEWDPLAPFYNVLAS